MVVNSETLAIIFEEANTLFANNLAKFREKTWYSDVTSEINVNTTNVSFPFSRLLDGMREWVGPKLIGDMRGDNMIIAVRNYERTIGLSKFDVQDDNLGIFRASVTQMASDAAMFPQSLITQLIVGGEVNFGYDGVPFFANNHPTYFGATVYDNLITNALSVDGLSAAYAAMGSYIKPDGSNAGIEPDTLIVPPALAGLAQILYMSQTLPGDVINPWVGRFKPVVCRGLATTTEWYMLDTSKGIKPYILAVRQDPEPIVIDDPTASPVFIDGQYLFGIEARYGIGYGVPMTSLKSTGTV